MNAVRGAVRLGLRDLPRGSAVLVAGSGGPDSSALTSATARVAGQLHLRAGFACVDHGWNPDSAQVAGRALLLAQQVGLEPAEVLVAPPTRTEGEAREVRRALLTAAAERMGASAILLGHSLDDQAETVLLGLARGSGARSLAGMAPVSGLWRRPLLSVRREVLREYCTDFHIPIWDDPSNADPRHARARVRQAALPALESALGPGIAEALARTADLLRADADALDRLAADADEAARRLEVDALAALEPALRSRVLRAGALAAGCPPSDLSAGHVAALDALVTGWHGQGPLDLPGPVTAARSSGRIELTPAHRGRGPVA
jgi:tRNA(Ile)-lysidine synthase